MINDSLQWVTRIFIYISHYIKYIATPALFFFIGPIVGWWIKNSYTVWYKGRYDRRNRMVDEFKNKVELFIEESKPIMEILDVIKIQIHEYEEIYQIDQCRKEKFVSGLHEFMENCSIDYGAHILRHLGNIPFTSINNLLEELQGENMRNSKAALDCYKYLEQFYATSYNTAKLLQMRKYCSWENPEVVKAMDQLKHLNIDELKKMLSEAMRLRLEFSRKNKKWRLCK